MAMPWPNSAPTLPRSVPAVSSADARTTSGTAARLRAAAVSSRLVTRAIALAAAPVTALLVMFVGLALLFVLPPVGLPFVAVVVLPAVVYHLRAERRTALRRPRT